MVLASTDLVLDRDGVVRRVPLTVEPACFMRVSCSTPLLDTFGFAAYRPYQLGGDFQSGPDLEVSNGTARFGQAWSTPIDGSGSILINFSGPPGNFEKYGHYISFDKVVDGTFDAGQVKDKLLIVDADAPWVQFPTQMAAQAHHTFTTQYTQQTVIAAGNSGSSDILVGEAAEEILARQPQSPN